MKITIISLLLLYSCFSFGQDSTQVALKKEKNLRLLPLPAIAASPTTGWMVGVAPGAYWSLGDKSNTSPSSALGSIIFTQKKQVLITAKANTFFSGDHWNMLTDFRFFINSQPTYGLGTGPQSAKPIGTGGGDFSDTPFQPIETAQMMEFNYLRIHNTVMKRIQDSRFFVGFGYHLDYHYKIKDELLDLESPDTVLTNHFAYSFLNEYDPTNYISSGASVNILYDSRDHTMNPYKGSFLQASYRVNAEWLGSSQNYQQLYLETRLYKAFSQKMPRHLLSFWAIGSFITSGEAPYLDLPSNSSDMRNRIGRGYVAGRFRGKDWVTAETEYRFPITKNGLLGGVVFASATSTSREELVLENVTYEKLKLFDAIRPAAGFGARRMLKRAGRMNLAADIAFGQNGSKGFYFAVGETF